MKEKVHIYICLHLAWIQFIAGDKTRLFPGLFLISTSRFLILADAFLSDHVAVCSTALCSATEMNEMGGYATVPCPFKVT